MSRFLVASLVACSMFVVSATEAEAGFGLLKKLRANKGGCGQASSCCTPAPACAPAPSCCAPAPAPTCCAPAPAPTCCAPAPAPSCGCSAPAPAPSCGGCGEVVSSPCSSGCGSPVVSSGCSSCGGSAVSYEGGIISSGVVSSGCTNCSQTMNSGVIVESAAPEAAPPAPAATPNTRTLLQALQHLPLQQHQLLQHQQRSLSTNLLKHEFAKAN